MSDVPLAILIPTRNRCETLQSTLQTCITQDYDRLQIIVSDNVSDDATRDVVASVRDPRIRYIRPDRRLSMSGNFEFSLGHAPDGYLMHLGDDDGMIAGGVKQVGAVIAETSALAVTSNHASYHWPNSLMEDRRNKLVLPIRQGFAVRNSLDWARKVIRFDKGYPALPGTYSSFVHTSVIERVKQGGAYYSSITPDSFSGFVNAGVLDRYAYSYRPFAVSGISGRSNGGSQFTRKDQREADNYLQENDLPTHPDVIYSPRSLEMIVTEAFLQARDRAPTLRPIGPDFERIARIALRDAIGIWYPEVREVILQLKAKHNLMLAVPETPSLAMKIDRELARVRTRISRVLEGYRRFDLSEHGVTDIAGAADYAAQVLK